jgi:hypothetical protein
MHHSLLLIAPLLLSACTWGSEDSARGFHTGWPPCPPDSSSGQDSEAPDTPRDLTLTGTVSLTLRRSDEQGEHSRVPWEESCFGETWPYGDIWVAVWDGESQAPTWSTTDTIHDPSSTVPSTNAFSVTIRETTATQLRMVAFIDKWKDGIIGPSDPVANVRRWIEIPADDVVITDLQIAIDTPYWCGEDEHGPCPDCPPSWLEGANMSWDGEGWVQHGGACSEPLAVSGDLRIHLPYNGTGSDALVTLLEPSSDEPYLSSGPITVVGDSSGAQGSFHVSACQGMGPVTLRAAWDNDGNGLYDPGDAWGTAVDAEGSALGDLELAAEDLEDIEVLVPSDGCAPTVHPIVHLEGSIALSKGGFDEVLVDHEDAHIHLAALRWAVSEPTQLSVITEHRALTSFAPEDLAGQATLPFELALPGHSPVQIRAWLDLDNDDTLAEDGEPAAWPQGSAAGWIDAGDSDLDGLIITLDLPSEPAAAPASVAQPAPEATHEP